jgi:hypothetical protein
MEAALTTASGCIMLVALPFCCCLRRVLGFIMEDMLHHGPALYLWGVTLPFCRTETDVGSMSGQSQYP